MKYRRHTWRRWQGVWATGQACKGSECHLRFAAAERRWQQAAAMARLGSLCAPGMQAAGDGAAGTPQCEASARIQGGGQ